jgi:hypothetical protein
MEKVKLSLDTPLAQVFNLHTSVQIIIIVISFINLLYPTILVCHKQNWL